MNRWAIFFLVLLPFRGWAQTAETALLVPFRPGLAWTVEELPHSRRHLSRDLQGAGGTAGAPSPSGGTTVVEENVILADGSRKQVLPAEKRIRYLRGGVVVDENPSSREFSIGSLDPVVPRDRISSTKLLEFQWIAPRWKTGTAIVDGVECDVFASPPPANSPEDSTEGTPPKNAWIYAAVGRADRMPRRLETPEGVWRYTFSMKNPPPELPAGAVLAIHRMNESAKEMAQRYAVPQ